MKQLLLSALIICSAFGLRAQSIERFVIAPTGGSYISGNNMNVDYTIGEVMVTTIGNTASILTQGFQQPFSNTYVMVEENTSDPVQVFLYPNPFVDQLNISVDNSQAGVYTILLFDILGQLVYQTDITPGFDNSATVTLNLNALSTGKYYLQVLSDKNIIQTSNIIKINQ